MHSGGWLFLYMDVNILFFLVGQLTFPIWLVVVSVLELMSTVILGDQVGQLALLDNKQVCWH